MIRQRVIFACSDSRRSGRSIGGDRRGGGSAAFGCADGRPVGGGGGGVGAPVRMIGALRRMNASFVVGNVSGGG